MKEYFIKSPPKQNIVQKMYLWKKKESLFKYVELPYEPFIKRAGIGLLNLSFAQEWLRKLILEQNL